MQRSDEPPPLKSPMVLCYEAAKRAMPDAAEDEVWDVAMEGHRMLREPPATRSWDPPDESTWTEEQILHAMRAHMGESRTKRIIRRLQQLWDVEPIEEMP